MKKFLMLAILAGAAFSAYAQVKVNDANNISISHSGGNLELNGTVLLKNPGTGALEDKVLTIDADGRIRSVTRAQLLDGLTGNYLSLSGGTLTGNLTGTTAYFQSNVGIGISTPLAMLDVKGTFRAGGEVSFGTANHLEPGTQSTFEFKSPSVTNTIFNIRNGSIAYNSYYGLTLETDGGENFVRSGAYTNLNLNAGLHSDRITLGFGDTKFMTLLNGSGNVGLGTTTPNAKLHIVGTALVTQAPTDPSGVVRKQDLENAVSAIDLSSYAQLAAPIPTGRIPFADANGKLTSASLLNYSPDTKILRVNDEVSLGISESVVGGHFRILSNGRLYIDNGSGSGPTIYLGASMNYDFRINPDHIGKISDEASGLYFIAGGLETRGKLGIGTNTPSEKLHVVGKALVTQAPTDPNGVVRKQDLEDAVSAIDLTGYTQQASAIPQGRIPFADANGKLTSENIFDYDPVNKVFRPNAGISMGIDNTVFSGALKVVANGNITIDGNAPTIALGHGGVYDFRINPGWIGSISDPGKGISFITGGVEVPGKLGVGTNNPSEKLHVVGKALVTQAPTDPNGVVRLIDLQNALAGVSGNVDSTKFIRNQNTAAQAANFWTSGVFRMDGRLGLNNAAAGPWVLDVNTAQYAYRITSNQQDLYGQLVSASGRAELGVMQDALYLQSTSELANGINLIDNSDAVHTFKSGRLGINNQNPAETLDVNGTGKFSGNVTVAGNVNSEVNSNLTINAQSGNGRVILSANDGVKVDLRDTGEGEFVVQNPSGALFSVISATKEVLIGEAGVGNAYLRPMASMPSGWSGSNFHVTGGKGDNGGGNLYLYGGDKQTSGNAGNTILAHTGSAALGKVGIGTNTPTEMLHVAGKALVTEAPTDPNGVVRLTDLQTAISGIDLSGYVSTNTNQTGLGGTKEWNAGHSWTLGGDNHTSIDLFGVGVAGPSSFVQLLADYIYIRDNNTNLYTHYKASSIDFNDSNSSNTLQINFPSSLTNNRTLAIPDASGTIALISDIPKLYSPTVSGDGTTVSFAFPHGLGYTPTMVMVTPNSADAVGKIVSGSINTQGNTLYATADSTHVTITYQTAPAAGTNNLKWTLMVK